MYKHLDLARNSFKEVIKFYGLTQIYLPYYLCDVMRHSAFEESCKPVFYHIDDKFLPLTDFKQDDFILYPNYFGICDDNVKILCNMYPNIIIDNAHSYFSEPSGRACFNSKRKFINVQKGSDLWIESITDNRKSDHELIAKRINNFNKIHQILKDSNLLEIKSNISPFCYPYLAKNEETANHLVEKLNGVEIFRYWNALPKNYNEYKFYSRLVPIPITQDISCKLT